MKVDQQLVVRNVLQARTYTVVGARVHEGSSSTDDEFQPLAEAVDEIVVSDPETVYSESEAREHVQNAYERGFNDGKQVATATMLTEIKRQQEQLRQFDSVMISAQEQWQTVLAQMEETIVSLSLAVASKIVGDLALSSHDVVVHQVRRALSEVRGVDAVVIRLHPEDADFLEHAQIGLVADPTLAPNIKISPDHTIEKGGCILETKLGLIDAQLRTQLAKIAEDFGVSHDVA